MQSILQDALIKSASRSQARDVMIQRKQSAYLLLGSLALAAVFFFWADAVAAVFPGYAPAVSGVGALAGLLGIVAIFMYGNRGRQQAAVLAAQLCTLAWKGLFTAAFARTGGDAPGSLLPMALLVCAYGFFWLARRAIRSDSALVRSADRIR